MITADERKFLVDLGRLSPQAIVFAPGLDWRRIVQAAQHHGVAPLLFKNLQANVSCPDDARHELRKSYIESAHRCARFQAALSSLMDCLARAGVHAIPLKGAYLAGRIYADPALRPFRDLDVLVQEENVDKAKAALLEEGFVLSPELWSEKFSRRFHFNLPFVKPGAQPIHLELHWALNSRSGPRGMDMEGIWQRAQPCGAGFALSPEDLLIHLAVHLDAHGFLNRALVGRDDGEAFIFNELSHNRLIWFVDLLEVISRDGMRIDWDVVIVRAGGQVATSLQLLCALYGPVVPAGVLSALKPAKSSLAHRAALRWLSKESGRPAGADLLLTTRKGFEIRLIRLLDLFAS